MLGCLTDWLPCFSRLVFVCFLSRNHPYLSRFDRSTSSGTKEFAPILTCMRPRCTCSVGMLRWRPYECNQAPAVPNHSATAHDLLKWFQSDTRFYFVNPSCFWCGSAPNALPAHSASENDDEGDATATYGRVPVLSSDALWIYADATWS